ncbi:MAG TPA: gamma-glutamylcyclotransferase [Bacillota bacterium]|nr:gamma-glutamylcyclotransferase [Bacillota bacterium]
MKIYAAYGSNMNIKQMKMRCPKAKLLGTGTIEGYRLTFRGSGRGVADIEKFEGRTVPVVLWKITNRCEESLDIYEGYPRLYVKRNVEIVNSKSEKIQAFVYVMADEYTDSPALPSISYLDSIRQGYMDNGIDTDVLRKAMREITQEVDERLYEYFNDRSGGDKNG